MNSSSTPIVNRDDIVGKEMKSLGLLDLDYRSLMNESLETWSHATIISKLSIRDSVRECLGIS